MRLLKKLLLWLVLFIALFILAVALWMSMPYPHQEAPVAQALQSDDEIEVSQGEYLVFKPRSGKPLTGLIFYPGGRTAAATFAPLLRQFAASGALVAAVPMPLNTAFLGVDKATAVMAAFPDIKHWYLAGHSLGGVAAAVYAATAQEQLDGLVLWASYPAKDISSLSLPVLSVYASKDLSTTPQDINQHRAWLPAGSSYSEIEGNHWQFGHYASSQNQQEQQITRQAQQAAVLSATLAFMGL